MADSPPCHFLKLPGELRNRIYRYAIVKNRAIPVREEGYERSAFLNTCKEIRDEGLKIYYYENKFRLWALQYNSNALLHWNNIWLKLEFSGKPFATALFYGRPKIPNWKNFIIWMSRIHDGSVASVPAPPHHLHESSKEYDVEYYVIGSIAGMVAELWELPWQQVEEMVKKQRPLLGKVDQRWHED